MLRTVSKLLKPRRGKSSGVRYITMSLQKMNQKDVTYDPIQVQSMKEQCILVNANDEPIGFASKESCHRVNLDQQVKMHRAFSVFLFNTKGEFLMQRRSKNKITFPDRFTNSCCSHPLYDIEKERTMSNALGVRRAAKRRLNYELGISPNEIQLDDLHYLTRIHYSHLGDGVWGENEISYIFIVQKDVELKPNKNEISELIYIKREDFEKTVKQFKVPLTPWFELMFKHGLLRLWWDNLHQLEKVQDHHSIKRLTYTDI